jgi:hypothetical protein
MQKSSVILVQTAAPQMIASGQKLPLKPTDWRYLSCVLRQNDAIRVARTPPPADQAARIEFGTKEWYTRSRGDLDNLLILLDLALRSENPPLMAGRLETSAILTKSSRWRVINGQVIHTGTAFELLTSSTSRAFPCR